MKYALLLCMAGMAAVVGTRSTPRQVLGPCGTPAAGEPAVAAAPAPGAPTTNAPALRPVPLPGQRAVNFELPAVVGDDVTTVRLSDYDGAWRVVCFYPADFTFV